MTIASRLFEDFRVGDTWTSPPIAISADAIMAFGRDFDPQPMHTDAALGSGGPFGGLVASGWHLAALSVRVFVEAGGYGGTPVVGLGVDELRWQRPVRAGDTLVVMREVIALRRSVSNPAHGIVTTRVAMRNQHEEDVMTLLTRGRVPTRSAPPIASEDAP